MSLGHNSTVNAPTLITLVRFFLAALFAFFILRFDSAGEIRDYWLGLAIFALAAISDGLDGLIARRFNLRTRLGAILDPLADKVFLNTAIVLLASGIDGLYRFPLWFAALVLGRDLLILLGALVVRWRKGLLEALPNALGKTTAVLQMILVIWALLKFSRPEVAMAITAAFTVASGIGYLRYGIRRLGENPSDRSDRSDRSD